MKVLHSIHSSRSALKFVTPIVDALASDRHTVELWVGDTPLSPEWGNAHWTARVVPCDITSSPMAFFRRLRAFRALLRNGCFDVLHAHQTRGSLIPLLAAKMEGVQHRVYHNHGLPYLGHRGAVRAMLRWIDKLNVSLSSDVLFVSDSNLKEARQDRVISQAQGSVIGCGSIAGVDLSEYETSLFVGDSVVRARRLFGVEEAHFVLGYIGRPVRRKGFHLLLRAWEREKYANRRVRLLIAGCSPTDCERAIGYLPKGVTALGYQADLRAFYAAIDAVVLPSYHEGFPYSLLEGAAAGRALIGSDIPGISSAIQHEKTGLVFRVGDRLALAEAINRLIASPELAKGLGSQARSRVERDFDRSTHLSQMVNYYRRIAVGIGSCC